MTLHKMLASLLVVGVFVLPSCRKAQAPAVPLASFPGRDPRLLWDASGRLHLLYVENHPEGPAIVYRRLGRDPIGPVRVSPPGLATAASRETPPTLDLLPNGTLVTGYPITLPGKWKSELRVQRSSDGGKSWGEPRLLNAPGSGAHSFLSSATSTSGTVAFAWLDNEGGQMGVHSSSTRDGGTFTSPATVDARTCQCCGTDMAAGRKGRLWLAYRDLEGDDLRDFQVLRSDSDPPVFRDNAKLSADGWRIRGCPETGARLIEAPDGTLWAAWFTAGGEAGIYVTSSHDGGAHFTPRTLVTPPGQPGRHPEIGVLADGRLAVLYEKLGEEHSPLQARVRDRHGVWHAPQTLVPEGAAYPRLATSGGRTVVAFTCHSGAEARVVVADWRDLIQGAGVPECAAKKSPA